MKVLIISCGIGMGHSSRDIALAEKLQKKGITVVFASYGSGYEMLKEYGKYEVAKLPDINFYGDNSEFDIKYTARKSADMPFIFIKSIYQESKIIKKFKPDVIIADSHYSVPITAKILGIPCILVTNELTLNFSDIYPKEKTMQYLEKGLKKFIVDVSNKCEAILIPDIKNSIEIPAKLKEKIIFTGPFLKQDPGKIMDKKGLRKKYGFEDDEKIVLVTVGGSDFGRKLLRFVYEASENIECDKIIMITGPQINSSFIKDSNKIIKKQFLEKIMEWMKLSDVIISLGGHNTTMEIATLGIPSIIIPIEKHSEQLKNASNMERYGIAYVKQINEIYLQDLADDINKILDDQILIDNIEIIKKEFLKYNGIDKAVHIILKVAKNN
ncbi:MAG: UDP-N-acetylglucosamine--N-acetylmuramyl-(pentapeptide) pyrophosphoryl-undecaprenol N-acetylglucosamine transferase [Methanobacterium sp.]